MNAKVDDYINANPRWSRELNALRSVMLSLDLQEEIKWGIPAYIHKKKNIMGMSAFKKYCGIWFHHGVFLKDEAKLLINAQKDKTRGLRQIRFTSLQEIDLDLVKQYIIEAIANSEAGKEIKPERNTKPLVVPKELQDQLSNNEKLNHCFEAFSLFKKREFCEYISSAKREVTKQGRLDKIIPMILNNVGLNDKYRNC